MSDDPLANDRALSAALRSASLPDAEQALKQLILLHYDELTRYVMRMSGAREVAEDLLQEVFLRVWRSRETLEIHEGWRAYLYAAARHAILDTVKREGRHARRLDAIAREQDWHSGSPAFASDQDLLEDLTRRDLVRAAQEALQTLPERCREVYLLSREHGLSYPEIARVMGISVNTVKTQMGRAIAVLRRAVAPFLGVMVLVSR